MDDRRALVISAHPDDIEFGCAGTTALWVEEGWDVRYVIVTSGERGAQHATTDTAEVAATRERESRQAAAICGVTDVTFLRYEDSAVIAADPLVLRKDLAREFRRHRPHRLMGTDPEIVPTDWFVNHPDHRAVGIATLDITVTGGTTGAIFPELELEEGLPPWRGLEEVWLTGTAGGPVAVDVTPVIDRRLDALRAHASQLGEWDAAAVIREHLRAAGEAHQMGYAETFRVISFRRP